MREMLDQGIGLGELGPLLEQDSPAPTAAPGLKSVGNQWQGYLVESLRAVEDYSAERLDALYNEACSLYTIDLITRNLVIPLLEQLGQRWDQRESGIAEEHFYSAWLRNKLGARLHHAQGAPKGRPLVLACLPQEQHELGLLLCALGVLEMGHRVIYLGANMPIRQIAPVSRHSHAIGILLAGREVTEPSDTLADITRLARAVEIPVFVGSHFVVQAEQELKQSGVIPLGNNLPLGLLLLETHLDGLAARLRSNSRTSKRQ